MGNKELIASERLRAMARYILGHPGHQDFDEREAEMLKSTADALEAALHSNATLTKAWYAARRERDEAKAEVERQRSQMAPNNTERARPDYDPKVDWPERYGDGPY